MKAAAPAQGRFLQGRRAGLASRGLADLFDVLVVAVAVVVVVVCWSALLFVLRRGAFRVEAPNGVQAFALGWVLAVGYLWAGWASTGRTVGKQIMGLRVVDGRGTVLSPFMALLRSLFCAAFPLGLLWCAVNRRNRSVQDLVLRSVVVHDWQNHAPQLTADDDAAAEEPAVSNPVSG
ncbi:MAG: RDD family protein [Actinomycetota bacterium]